VEEAAQVGGGFGGLGGIEAGGAGGAGDGLVRGDAVLAEADEGGEGLAGEAGAGRAGEGSGVEGTGEDCDLFPDAALALGLAGGFLEAALGLGVHHGLGTDGGGERALGVGMVRGEEKAEDQAGDAEEARV
jgi:hypothetical protein